jgi:hypothetical protein
MLAGNMGNTLRSPGGAKACARAAGPKSRALETDASRLNGRKGAWGSSAGLPRGAVGQVIPLSSTSNLQSPDDVAQDRTERLLRRDDHVGTGKPRGQ